jgi:hypothetical protein
MFHSYKNCKIHLNNSGIIADSVDFQISAQTSPVYHAEKKYAQGSSAARGAVGGKVNIGYFITGDDPLREFIYSEVSGISGNFAGLTFGSGYLTSYSLELTPNSSAHVSAEIDFFDQLTGTFDPATEELDSVEPLNASEITLNGTGFGDLSNVMRASLNYKNDVKASYHITLEEGKTNIKPNRIVFGKKQLVSSLVFDSVDGNLGLYGNYGTLTFGLKDRDGNLQSEYSVKGRIQSKGIGASSEGFAKCSLKITQDAPSENVTITDFHPESGVPGDKIVVSGTNFHFNPILYLEKYELKPLEYISQTELRFTTPNAPIPSGNLLVVRTDLPVEESFRTENFYWQESGGNFKVIYNDPSIGATFAIV